MGNTSSLRELVRELGCCSLVIESGYAPAMAFSEPPEELLTASCRENGLSEAIDSSFDEE